MTELRIEKMTIPSVEFNGVSTLPAISEQLRLSMLEDRFELGEDDGLFINYGMVDYVYPYKVQDNYTRELKDKEQACVVLENEHLKATFFPQFGGKLHSLFDKDEGKDLLFSNSIVRPCHLAVRNAWMSGGVEWNCGYVGHHPFTCDLMHTAQTKLEDGTPVLRFYQYERIRAVVYQLDFFLPEGSKLLFVRTKIINPSFNVVPMYWWSNIATPEKDGSRVIVPASNTYTTRDGHPVKIAIPEYNGINVTYPSNNVISIDYFWNIPEEERKFVCQVDKDGYGLVQTSTKRLQGRKLFVWGNSRGGDKWKNFLTADGESGSYNEIQAGIAKTQYECLPMPPKTAWEWVEAYGAIHTDPEKVHGDWEEAKRESACRLNELISAEDMNALLRDTKKMSKTPAEKMLFRADGWGALEQERRRICGEEPLCSHLDFGEISEEQMPWLALLKDGSIGRFNPSEPPISYMLQKEWTLKLQRAVEGADSDNWFALLQLGLVAFIEKDYRKAELFLERSLKAEPSPWALYALSIVNRDRGDHDKEVELMLAALSMRSDDVSLAKEALRCLYHNRRFASLKSSYEAMPDIIKQEPRCLLYYAFALLDTGDIAGAESILYRDGGIILPDIREGETITFDLWLAVEKKKAQRDGVTFDSKKIDPPSFVDFRMFSNIEWLNGGELVKD
jgi:tetratricopeptide (TPR) repeat protein